MKTFKIKTSSVATTEYLVTADNEEEAKENWENAEHYSMEVLCYDNEQVETIEDIAHENK